MAPFPSRWTRLLTAAVLLGIAAVTLVPHPGQEPLVRETPITCLVCGSLGGVDVLLNVVLFVPLGAALVWSGLPRGRAVILAAIATFAIEALQWGVIPGRDPSLSDLLTNTLGGFLGATLAAHWRRVLHPAPSWRRRMLLAGSAVWLAILATTGWLLLPAMPDSVYYGQWAADLPHLERFEGTVRDASLDGIPIPGHRLRETGPVRAALADGDARLVARADAAGPTPDLAPIVSIFDREQREIVMLGQDRRTLVFRVRTHAADARLRVPGIRLPDALAGGSGSTVQLIGTYAAGRLGLAAAGGGRLRQATQPLSVGLGWALLMPVDYWLGPESRLGTALWLAGLLVPLGLWSRGVPGAPSVLGVTVALGLLVLPWGLALPPAHWSEWVAAGAGLALGRWFARRGAGPPGRRGDATGRHSVVGAGHVRS